MKPTKLAGLALGLLAFGACASNPSNSELMTRDFSLVHLTLKEGAPLLMALRSTNDNGRLKVCGLYLLVADPEKLGAVQQALNDGSSWIKLGEANGYEGFAIRPNFLLGYVLDKGMPDGGLKIAERQSGCVVTGEPWRAEFNYVGVSVNLPNATGEYTTTRTYYGQPASPPRLPKPQEEKKEQGPTITPPQSVKAPALAAAKPVRPAHDAETEKELRDFAVYLEKKSGHHWPEDQMKLLNLLGEVLERIRNEYVHEVNLRTLLESARTGIERLHGNAEPADLIEAAMSGMLNSLDSGSGYISAKGFRELQVATKGLNPSGAGADVRLDNGKLKIVDVLDNSPAAKAGLLPGDFITHIDGAAVPDLRDADASSRLRGPENTELRLAIHRGNEDPFDVTLKRAVVIKEPVIAKAENDIGYIRVTNFNESTEGKLRKAIASLKNGESGTPKGYVLDLRNNQGGLLDQCVSVSEDFLDKGEILSTRNRHPEDFQRFTAHGHGLIVNEPLVVLVNGETASGAEIVAAALRDNHRATLIGEHTFGRGSIQTFLPLPGHGAMRLTTSYFFTPSGQTIQGTGLQPDIQVDWSQTYDAQNQRSLLGDPQRDLQLARAIDFLHGAVAQ